MSLRQESEEYINRLCLTNDYFSGNADCGANQIGRKRPNQIQNEKWRNPLEDIEFPPQMSPDDKEVPQEESIKTSEEKDTEVPDDKTDLSSNGLLHIKIHNPVRRRKIDGKVANQRELSGDLWVTKVLSTNS